MLTDTINERRRQTWALVGALSSAVLAAALITAKVMTPFMALMLLAMIWSTLADWLGRRPSMLRNTMTEIYSAFKSGRMKLHGFARAISIGSSLLFGAALLSLFIRV